jgi:hypothetical protein
MGACENPNLPVEMAEARVKDRANEPAAHDTTKLPEETTVSAYPQHPFVEQTFKRRKTPQREIAERASRLGTVVTGWMFVRVDCWLGFAAMTDAERPTPELYRDAAERLRQMARECRLPDIQGDLLDLAARFERMAAYFEAQRPGAPRDPRES